MEAFSAGTSVKLNGCVNDVRNMQAMLTETFGFPADSIQVLIDVGAGTKPTGKTIKDTLAAKVQACEAGDVLFFFFSGHGTQLADRNADETTDQKDEAIVPTDLNLITDDDLRAIFGTLPANVSLTVVCYLRTGSLIHEHEDWRSSEELHKTSSLKILSRTFVSCAQVLM
jgi:hypothetical protein